MQQIFFDSILKFEPEEATSLGLDLGGWRRWDDAGLAHERAVLVELQRALATQGPSLDIDAMRRWITWRLHSLAQELHQVNTEAWALCQATLTLDRLRGRPDPGLRQRLETLGEPLDALATHHLRGLARGRTAHPEVLAAIQDELAAFSAHLSADDPAWRQRPALHGVLPSARQAVDRYRAVVARVHADAVAPKPLGRDEVDFRLRHTMGLQDDAAALRQQALDGLRRAQDQLVAVAGRLQPGIRSFQQVPALVQTVLTPRPSSTEAVLDLYRGHVDRARQRVQTMAPGLLPDAATVHIAEAPPGLPHAANWPAPLLAQGQGAFFVAADPALHPLAWSADLAVHEAIPGHFLQSAVWQRRFGSDPCPVRCMFLSDPVAIAHGFYGAMCAVEGWAVYAERWMRSADFYTPEEELCVLLSDTIRFARLYCDLGLHCGELTGPEVVSFIARETALGEGLGQRELLRYRRIPLQASTYAAGLLGIERLRAAHPGPDFHRWLLEQGAVPPDSLADVPAP